MADVIFASKAVVGERYVTKGGFPVTVLEVDTRCVVRNNFTGVKSRLWLDQLLWPYDTGRISKEAIEMSKIAKASKPGKEAKVKGADRGARKTGDGIILFRMIGTVEHQALFHGGVLTVKGKDYMTMSEAAAAMAGKKVEYPHSYFGLKTEPNITLGKEVIMGLESAQKMAQLKEAEVKKAAKVKKVKAKKTKADDDEEDAKPAKSVGEAVAKVFSKGGR